MKKHSIVLSFLLINVTGFVCSMQRNMLDDFTIEPVDQKNRKQVNIFIQDRFKKHAIEKTGRHGNIAPFHFNIAHKRNKMAAFIKGASFWGGLHIDNMYVQKNNPRSKGFGPALIDRVYKLAEEKVYKFVSVETFDNALLTFLVSQGFEVDFSRKGYGKGFVYHYLSKNPKIRGTKKAMVPGFSGGIKNEFNLKELGEKSSEFGFVLKSDKKIIGAITARMFLGCVHICNLIVQKECRGMGFGRLLLESALENAKSKNCTFAVLETFNFHAPDFYEKLGFNVDFARKGYDSNSTYYYFRKKL